MQTESMTDLVHRHRIEIVFAAFVASRFATDYPQFVGIEMYVTADSRSRWERVSQHATASIERPVITVMPGGDAYRDIHVAR